MQVSSPEIKATRALIDELEGMGYFNVRIIEQGEFKGQYVGLYRFIFTIGVIVGMDLVGYDHRYCYDSIGDAKKGLEEVAMGRIPTGYIKRKG